MTIYTSTTEKKDNSSLLTPQVVVDLPALVFKKAGEDAVPLVQQDNERNGHTWAKSKRRRRVLCLLFFLLMVLITSLFALIGLKLYSYYLVKNQFYGVCGVTYLDEQEHYYEFQESVESDGNTWYSVEVPEIDDFRKVAVLHDFESNYTAIVDKVDGQCFIMSLNRSMVKPPKDFWDLISKLRTGYYLPDEHLVRENFRVQEPIGDLTPYGDYITSSCYYADTFSLERIEAPKTLTKREACRSYKFRYSSGVAVEDVSILRCD